MKPILAILLAPLLLVTGCSSDPGKASFSENVGETFAQCNPAEIRFLAGKHNFMSAFENCGSNNFKDYAWSPNGTHLYFQLTLTHHIMDAEADDRKVITVPTESPTGGGGWLNSSRIAIPIGKADDEDDSVERIAVYDMDQNSLITQEVPGLTGIDDIAVGASPSDVLFTGVSADGVRKLHRLDLDDGTVSLAYPWLDAEVSTFSYTPSAGALSVGSGGQVTLYRAQDGHQLGQWSPANAGSLHADGRWMLLEHDGEAISVFYQRHWDELSENARARELARAKRFEEALPEWYPKEVQPPMLSVVDLTSGERWAFTGFMGHHAEWYGPTPYYASLILWGFEGKEYNRNIILGNLADRLNNISRGEEMMGVQPWDVEGSTNTVSDEAKAGLVEDDAGPIDDPTPPDAEPQDDTPAVGVQE